MNAVDMRARVFFFLTLLVLLILALLVLKPFFTTIIFTTILIIILKPAYNYILKSKLIKGHSRLAATVTLLLFVVLLFIPLILLFQYTASQLSGLAAELGGVDFEAVIDEIEGFLSAIPLLDEITIDASKIKDIFGNVVRGLAGALGSLIISLITSIPQLIFQAIIFLVLFVTLLPEYDQLVERIQATSPLGKEISKLYITKTTAMVNSLVLGIFIIAFIQGIAMGFFYWLAGVEYVYLVTIIAILFAMLPVVGISYLTIAIAILFLIQGELQSAVIVLFGFYGIVNWIDIFLRPKLVSKEAYVNFTLLLLGILGGVLWAGILGLFIGPVVILLLVTTIDIYQDRLAKEDGKAVQTFLGSKQDEGEELQHEESGD